MAIINIGKNNNYKAEKSFVPDYVDYVIEREMEEHLKEYDEHMSNTDNPHKVTKSQVGLSNVDNTSDLNKPISTATQAALDKKANQTDVDSIKNNTTLIKNSGGGFSAGENADTETGGSAGRGSFSTTGGASGHLAQTQTGGAVGQSTKSTSGGAVGTMVQTQTGGAVGTSATSTNGGAIGSMANTTTGGAVGEVANSESGGAVGFWASSESGGAVGNNTGTSSGGAIGNNSHSGSGASVGENTSSTTGGAIGADAKAGAGFAGGKSAKAVDSSGGGIDAIQLGTGTNSVEGTLQVYSYQLLDEEGKIPDARLNDATSDGGLYGRKDGAWERVTKDAIGLSNVDNTSDANKPISAETQAALDAITENTSNIQNSSGGFSAGMTSQAKGGGAVGSGSYANSGFAGGVTAYAGFGGAVGAYAQVTGGGAVGQNAVTSDGFAGGKNAIAGEDYSNGIDAIQLGTGTNSAPKTMQVYGYQLLDANGKIPDARLNDAPSDGNPYARKDSTWENILTNINNIIAPTWTFDESTQTDVENTDLDHLPQGITLVEFLDAQAMGGYMVITPNELDSEPYARQYRVGRVGLQERYSYPDSDAGGIVWSEWDDMIQTPVVDNLESSSGTDALSANQGRILDEKKLNDAPSDGNTYARKNGIWEAIISGLPSVSLEDLDTLYERGAYVLYYSETYDDGEGYGERTFNYTDLVVISTSNKFAEPNATQTRYTHDGKIYIRGGYTGNTFSGMRWSEVSFADAPSDSNTYARKDGSWEELTDLHTHANKSILDATEVAYTESDQARISTLENDLDTFYIDLNDLQNTAVTDAPSDGNTYARKDGAWANMLDTSDTTRTNYQLINFIIPDAPGAGVDNTNLDDLPNGITIVGWHDGQGVGGYMVITMCQYNYGNQIKIAPSGISRRYNNGGTWNEWSKIS